MSITRSFALIVSIGIALAGFEVGSAKAATVDFTTLGEFATPELGIGGIAVTGSANVFASSLGLGIVGGSESFLIEGLIGEFILFTFAVPVINVFFTLEGVSIGELTITIFTDEDDEIVEVIPDPPPGTPLCFSCPSVPEPEPEIESFQLTPDVSGGSFRVTSVSFEVAVIPLPAALPLYGTGLAVMGFLGWRRKRRAAA